MRFTRGRFAALGMVMAQLGVFVNLSAQDTPVRDDSALAAYGRRAWETVGREKVSEFSGVRRDPSGTWSIDPSWASADDAGAKAYFIEPQLRGVLSLADATGDRSILEDVAQFYIAYESRLRTVGVVLSDPSRTRARRPPASMGSPQARTIPWLDHSGNSTWVSECALCNAQFFHPAARLIRLIAAVPPSGRSATMLKFVADYVPLLVAEHLIRIGYEAHFTAAPPPGLPDQLVPLWEAAARGEDHRKYRLVDRDLWIIAAAAELLEAHRLAPELVSLGPEEARLHRMVTAGARLLQTRTSIHHETRDFHGRTVGSLGYFEGDFDDYPDMAFAGYSSKDYPGSQPKRPARGGSWDVSHIQRLPVFLRSLWDARRATNLDFPDSTAMAQTVNQYVYRVFLGDYQLPQFKNFFDGSDGWYRVGYSQRTNWGYPPSQFCDGQDPGRPCLAGGAIVGWGLLAFLNPDLEHIGPALVRLAASNTPDAVALRSRAYASGKDLFTW